MFEKKESGHGKVIGTLAATIILCTVANMAFNYFVVAPKVMKDYLHIQYDIYGGQDNYEKQMLLTGTQTQATLITQFANQTKEEMSEFLKGELNKIKEQTGLIEPTVEELDMGALALNTPVYGNEEAPVSILEFSDLECPACQGFHKSGLVKSFIDANPDAVNYIYKNFQFHEGAPMKGEIGLCVAELDGGEAFYNYIDAHFNSDNLRASKEDMIARVVAGGTDEAQLTACLDAGTKKAALEDDRAQGDKFGVTGTPTVIVINNATGKWVKLQARSEEGIQSAIDSVK